MDYNDYIYSGIAYGTKGDYDKAIRDYTHVIALNPEYVDAYGSRELG